MTRVLHVCEGLSPRLGGTAMVVRQLVNSCMDEGLSVSLVAPWEADAESAGEASEPSIHAVRFGLTPPSRLGLSPELSRLLGGMPPPDVVHIHGLWRLFYAQAARFADRTRIPFVLSTHGMLQPSALRIRGQVKRLARLLFQQRVLRRATCLHASSESEVESIRRFGRRGPVALIPWGVEAPPRAGWPRDQEFANKWGVAPGVRVLLFLSRLHPIKGLEALLQAWSDLHERFPDWQLVVAGRGEPGYETSLGTLKSELGLDRRTVFVGPVEGGEREALFCAAELFVLPSYSENFGLVVGEALARGVPVVTTKETPWSRIETWNCGWWIEAETAKLRSTLQNALSRSEVELRRMGEAGRAAIRRTHAPARAAGSFVRLYNWLCGHDPKPEFVQDSE